MFPGTVGGFPLGSRVWGKGMVVLPSQAPVAWRNVFTDQAVRVRTQKGRKMLPLSKIFQDFPVALMTKAKVSPNRNRT